MTTDIYFAPGQLATMIPQRRSALSAGIFPRTSSQTPKTRKRVRFMDRSFAQELIRREKARLEEKMQALRQAYDFRHAVAAGSDDPADSTSTGPNRDEQPRRSSIKLQVGVELDGEEEKADKLASKDLKERYRQWKKKHRQGSLSAERLSELAKPRSKNGMLPTNSSRRNAIVAASPEHLKLSVPERAPRTIPQLKNLTEDEVDYLVQPKTLQEFQQLAEMSFPPSKICRRSQNGRESRAMSGAHPQQESHSPGARGVKRRDTWQWEETRTDSVNYTKSTSSAPARPSFKMAALGVLSMKSQERHDMAQNSSPQFSISDLLTKSMPPKLALQQRAKPSIGALDMQSDVPGGRILRLRPRKSAWQESRLKKRPAATSTTPPTERCEKEAAAAAAAEATPVPPEERSNSVAFSSPIKYHSWKDKPTIDVEQLTKNLSKCSYLRQTDEDIDTEDVFGR